MNFFKLPEVFRDRHAGEPGLLICRSPWVNDDLDATPTRFLDGVRVGVNHSILRYPLDYCVGGDPAFWGLVNPDRFPETQFLTHNMGHGYLSRSNVASVRCLIPRSTVSSIFALWFCWYLGLNPVRICGAHFKVRQRENQRPQLYGDFPAEYIVLDRPERVKYINNYIPRLPRQAKDFSRMVTSIREQGTEVIWPGELTACGTITEAGQELPVHQRYDKTLIEPNHQAAHGSQGQRVLAGG